MESRSAEYRCWERIKQRCHNRAHHRFPAYGGRGIVVCSAWRASYAAFLADMGRKPTPAHTIERINNNGNYEPGNCRWATVDEQRRNMGWSVYVDVAGRRELLIDIAKRTAVPRSRLYSRLVTLGWTFERAMTT